MEPNRCSEWRECTPPSTRGVTAWLSRPRRLTRPATGSYAPRDVPPVPLALHAAPRRCRRRPTPDRVARTPASDDPVIADLIAVAPDLGALPIAGITRRRMAGVLGGAARGLGRHPLRAPGRRGRGGHDPGGADRAENAAISARGRRARARARADRPRSASSTSRPVATGSAATARSRSPWTRTRRALPDDAPGLRGPAGRGRGRAARPRSSAG